MDSADDDAARRARRAKAARNRRAARRQAREEAWRATQVTGGNVAGIVTALDTPPSMLLATHVQRTAVFLDRLERDDTVPLVDRVRVFVAAIPALSKACEAHEFRTRLEDLEQRIAGRPRGAVA